MRLDVTLEVKFEIRDEAALVELCRRARELDDEVHGEHQRDYEPAEAVATVLQVGGGDMPFLFKNLAGWWVASDVFRPGIKMVTDEEEAAVELIELQRELEGR